MRYILTIRAASPRHEIESRLRELTRPGPFRVGAVSPLGGDSLAFVLEPATPSIAIGFAKVAELLLLLARGFEVTDVGRVPDESMAAAG